MSFSVFFSRRAEKELKALEKRIAKRCLERIKALSENPAPKGAIKLKGLENVFRIRIGKYRIVYKVFFEKRLILIVRIGKRESVYEGIA